MGNFSLEEAVNHRILFYKKLLLSRPTQNLDFRQVIFEDIS